ncbi:MAG: HlyD family efflux transporter periplasmic adaptor subunit [Boseongicola sp.]|nr:HlyD family efflux transporter periplasmic adaptor subunit [Boseongicola sp.]
MRFLRRSMVGIFLLSVTVGLLAWAGGMVYGALQASWAEEPQQRPTRERVFAANVLTFTPETIRPVLNTFGEVRARRSLELRAATGGDIVWMSDDFEEGGQVKAGDLLVRIDPADAQAKLDTVRADLLEAEADVRDSERLLELAVADVAAAEAQERLQLSALARQRDLLERGVGSAAAVENAELAASSAAQSVLSRRQAHANAEARMDQTALAVERQQIALADAERGLAETEIKAEFDGVLGDVGAVVGRLVSPNEKLADLIDPSALEVSFRVSTPQYARLIGDNGRLVGADVTAAIDVFGVSLEAKGTISRESAAVDAGQTGRLLFARLEDATGFRPGDFVSVRIVEPELQRVARLPASAIDAGNTVLVLGEEDRLEVAEVDLLRREGDDVIVRARGLAGREIITERTPLLGAGIRVRPIRPGGAEAPDEPEMLALEPERRARLVAFVEANDRMPAEIKTRVLAQLEQEMVPAQVVERLEARMGG